MDILNKYLQNLNIFYGAANLKRCAERGEGGAAVFAALPQFL
jgi:hypothetical protein